MSEKMREKLDDIFEMVFRRGFAHGVSGGLSDDGESVVVEDAVDVLLAVFPILLREVTNE